MINHFDLMRSFYRSVSLSLEKSRFVALLFQLHHMSVMASHIPTDPFLFHSSFGLTANGTSKVHITGPLWVESQEWPANAPRKDTISYPLLADVETGLYPYAPLQYHAQPKAMHGIAILRVDKFPYTRKQTRGSEFIPCPIDTCHILKRSGGFNVPAIPLMWPNSSY